MCDKKIFLSVVLPVYNGEKYLRLAIDSILKQTYPNFELIILNDGSTDKTEEIIKSYNDPRIVYVEKANTGLADTLNVGWKMARYDWIARMDSDDIAFPNRFEEQVKYLTDDIDIIGSAAIIINQNGDKVGSIRIPTTKQEIVRKNKTPFIHPTVIIRKSILEKLGGYDTNLRRSEDINLWMRYFHAGNKICNLQYPLLYYRMLNTTQTSEVRVVEPILAEYMKQQQYFNLLSKEQYKEVYVWISSLWTYKLCFVLSRYMFMSNLNMKIYSAIWKICNYINWHIIFKKKNILKG